MMSEVQTVSDRYQTICEESKEKFPDFIGFLKYRAEVRSFLRYWQQTSEQVRTETMACGFGAALLLAALDSRQADIAAVIVREVRREGADVQFADSRGEQHRVSELLSILDEMDHGREISLISKTGNDVIHKIQKLVVERAAEREEDAEEFEDIFPEPAAVEREKMSLPEFFDIAGGSYENALRQMQNDKLIFSILNQLMKSVGESIPELCDAIRKGDMEKAWMTALSLRNTANNCGVTRMAAVISRLVDYLAFNRLGYNALPFDPEYALELLSHAEQIQKRFSAVLQRTRADG